MMSSTSAVLMPVRSASARNTVAPNCCGWIPDKAPLPALPMPRGVLHASMISASTMVFPSRSVDWPHLLPIKLQSQMATSLPSPQRQDLFCRAQMRLVDHLAIDLHDARSRIVAECLDHLLRPGDFLVCRHEGGVDDVDMLWMDDRLAEETVLTPSERFCRSAVGL